MGVIFTRIPPPRSKSSSFFYDNKKQNKKPEQETGVRARFLGNSCPKTVL
jgi:hypothetical protein